MSNWVNRALCPLFFFLAIALLFAALSLGENPTAIGQSTAAGSPSTAIANSAASTGSAISPSEQAEETARFQAGDKFSFMWMGDDNPSQGRLGIRYGYTTHPDMEIVFSIPDLGRERSAEYGSYAAEWQLNPNADPSFSPIFMGLGNHDIERPTVVDYTSKVLGPQLTATLPGMENFREGPYLTYPDHGNYADTNLTYSFDYKNAHFVMLNIYSHDILLPDGGFDVLTLVDFPAEAFNPLVQGDELPDRRLLRNQPEQEDGFRLLRSWPQ